MYWEAEMSMSVHPESELIDVQCVEEGAQCKVRFGRDVYDWVIAATGIAAIKLYMPHRSTP